MSEHFPELKSSGGRMKVVLDLSYYVIKADLKMQKELIHKNLIKRLI